MQAGQWHRLKNAPDAEIWSHLVKPDVRTCNSFVIRTPTHLFVVDPGGAPAQAAEVFDIVRAERELRARPVYVCFTHCHIDHVLGFVAWSAGHSIPDLRVVLHEAGVRAWQEADRQATQAEILEQPLESWTPPGLQTISPRKRNKKGAPDFCIGNQLEVFLTPGHCSDSVCFRLGEVLLVGDLLVATAPLVAGAKGWDSEALSLSLERISRLVDEAEIEYGCPGHGGILERAVMAKALRRTLSEAAALKDIEAVNVSRVRAVSGTARELFDELVRIFGVIQGRIERLAQRLQSLEETAASARIREILDSGQVIGLLGEFRLFEVSLRAGAIVEVQLAMKSIQMVPRILKLLEYDRLKVVLDPALLRYARLLLTDFVHTAKGLRVEDERAPLELAAWCEALVAELGLRPDGGLSADDIPDDEEGFRQHLIRRLAYVPVFKAVTLEAKPCTGPVWVSAAEPRLRDTWKRLLEECVEAGARRLTLSVTPGALSMDAHFPGGAPKPEALKLQGCIRSLNLAGVVLQVDGSGEALRFALRFIGSA
ncbi:MAG TPA: hypothetical protein DCZ95_11580 [Verrucomicrobia bacterium]|nr:MAG: hypothetical protein A2X46_01845 [Lentisphaerae bacterium GWF2_57_35]HBA84725.1 hypothetical protein [Verrucomicrobiota bacterium]